MCKLMEERAKAIADEARAVTAKYISEQNAMKMLNKKKFSLEDISDCSGLSLIEVKELAKKLDKLPS